MQVIILTDWTRHSLFLYNLEQRKCLYQNSIPCCCYKGLFKAVSLEIITLTAKNSYTCWGLCLSFFEWFNIQWKVDAYFLIQNDRILICFNQELKRSLPWNCKIFVSVLIVLNFQTVKRLDEGKSLKRSIVTVAHESLDYWESRHYWQTYLVMWSIDSLLLSLYVFLQVVRNWFLKLHTLGDNGKTFKYLDQNEDFSLYLPFTFG